MAKVGKMLTSSKKREITELVKARKNLDLLAEKAQVSKEVIDRIMVADGDLQDIFWNKVWKIVDPDSYLGLIQTATYQTVCSACNRARSNTYMTCILGDTGLGKTMAAEHYSKNDEVFYIRIDNTYNDQVFLCELASKIGLSNNDYNSNSYLKRIASRLNYMESPLIIIDECSKLKPKLILLLHSLRDLTKDTCGMVLLGMPYFKNNLIKQIQKGVLGFSEFYRRINIWVELEGLGREEIQFILQSRGITETQDQQRFLKIKRFGDLDNEIKLFIELNHNNE